MYDKIGGSDVIDPSRMSSEEKLQFINSLYQRHSRIFDGVDRSEFIPYVVDSPAEWTRIRVYINSKDEWVGYCAVHRFDKKVFDRPCVIFRAEAGILREYRGRSQTLWFGFGEAIKFRLMHPRCKLYYLGSFVHPAVLYMFSRYFGEYYPRFDEPIPASVKDFILKLADLFHIEPVKGGNELAVQVGWITKESDEDRSFWQNHQNPAVKFYIKTNPGYVKGNGLLTLVPLTFGNILISLNRFVGNKLRKRFFH
jgi:hypothetical protein